VDRLAGSPRNWRQPERSDPGTTGSCQTLSERFFRCRLNGEGQCSRLKSVYHNSMPVEKGGMFPGSGTAGQLLLLRPCIRIDQGRLKGSGNSGSEIRSGKGCRVPAH
jgi:hypothetical protein